MEERLGRRVAELRELAGLTQAQLAEKIDVSTETVSRLERGAAVPSLARLEDLATALGIDLARMFDVRTRSARRRAEEKLLLSLRRRSADDIELLVGLAALIFDRPQKP